MPTRPVHALHAVLLAGTVPLFLGVLFSDMAYSSTFEIQWKNFASWLLVGGLVFGGFALLWAVIDIVRATPRTTRHLIYIVLLLVLWVLGFINALVHAGDAWASMPTGLILSWITAALAIGATWLVFSRAHPGVRE
jgi:uncharacterized membrane protein